MLASLAEQILLFLRRFIVGSSVRFGLVDNWLHRTIVRWLDPELNDLIVWLTLNELNCIAEVIAATTYHPYLITYAYFIIIRTLHPFFILRDSSATANLDRLLLRSLRCQPMGVFTGVARPRPCGIYGTHPSRVPSCLKLTA